MIRIQEVAVRLVNELSSKVFGQKEVIESIVLTVLCRGHALLTGAPGVAKTTLVRNLASALGCGYKRIQFTPDLTPYDILGGETLVGTGQQDRRLEFVAGPIFSPFILADEINRASPKTQSALLEAMQERQVSVAGMSRPLPRPFYVFATQNPLEHEGTFPLPEAQLDRFLMNISVPYPDLEAEVKVATMNFQHDDLVPLEGAEILFSAREAVETFPMHDLLVRAAVKLVRNTRPEETELHFIKDTVQVGASPRASQSLVIAAKALALAQGAREVDVQHLKSVAANVLRHRFTCHYAAVIKGVSPDTVIQTLLNETVL